MKIKFYLLVLVVYLFCISNGCIYQNPNNLSQIYNFTSIVLPKNQSYTSYFPDAFLMKGLSFNVAFNLCNQPVPESFCLNANSSACQLGFRNEVGSINIPEILSFGPNQLNITYTAKPKSDCTRRGLFVFTCNPLTDFAIKGSAEVELCLYQTNIETKFVCDVETPTPSPTNTPQKCLGNPECGGVTKGYCSQGVCNCYPPFIGIDCSSQEISPTELPITQIPLTNSSITCELSENGLFVESTEPIKCVGHGSTLCTMSNGDTCKSNKGVIECFSKRSSILCKGTFIDCESSYVSCSFHKLNTNRLFVNGIENINKSKIYKN